MRTNIENCYLDDELDFIAKYEIGIFSFHRHFSVTMESLIFLNDWNVSSTFDVYCSILNLTVKINIGLIEEVESYKVLGDYFDYFILLYLERSYNKYIIKAFSQLVPEKMRNSFRC